MQKHNMHFTNQADYNYVRTVMYNNPLSTHFSTTDSAGLSFWKKILCKLFLIQLLLGASEKSINNAALTL